MTADLLRHYQQAQQQTLPQVIVMFRDGVSNSMFDAVLAHEHTAIKQVRSGVARRHRPCAFVLQTR